jgi:general stress protein 26
MPNAADDGPEKVWELIKGCHSALLVTIGQDGRIDSRPMGCIQKHFEDTVWFLTFAHSLKLREIGEHDHVLVSYANPSKYEYVSLSGRAKIVKDPQRVKEFWSEAFRVWFPSGPDDPELTLISVEVEEAKYWTNAASVATYAWAYLKARLVGVRPDPKEVTDLGSVRF